MTLIQEINWKIALFTALLLPLLLSLGAWQLRREQEKIDIQALYQARQSGQPMSLAELQQVTLAEQAWAPVWLEGEYDNAHSFLLDNRTHEGRLGMELITPFTTEGGSVALVNRGWIPRDQYRTILPEPETVAGRVRIAGSVYIPDGEPFMLGAEDPFSTWPRVLQSIDTGLMYRELQLELSQQALPWTIRIGAGMAGAEVRYWQAVNMSPEKHRAYAIQWFTMAAVLVLLVIYSIFRSIRQTRQHPDE